MKKNFLLVLILVIIFNDAATAQGVATAGSIEYQRGYKPAAVIDLPYHSDIVEDAIRDDFKKKGIKEEKLKGFLVYKGVRLNPTDGEVVDLYFKTDRKNRKETESAKLYMIVGRPNENVSLRGETDAYKMEEAKTYLNSMTPSIKAFALEVDILNQEEVINKNERKLKNLQENQVDLEKRIKALEEKLAQNKRDQEAQIVELNNQKTIRDTMMLKRTTQK